MKQPLLSNESRKALADLAYQDKVRVEAIFDLAFEQGGLTHAQEGEVSRLLAEFRQCKERIQDDDRRKESVTMVHDPGCVYQAWNHPGVQCSGLMDGEELITPDKFAKGGIVFAKGGIVTGTVENMSFTLDPTVKDKRYFASGAYRDVDENKLDFEGFLSPAALTRYAEYMHKHRKQSDGEMRDSDNWQKGIPRKHYMKSLWRHFVDMWTRHRKGATADDADMQEVVCSVIFNAFGYLHEMMEGRDDDGN